MDIVNSLRVLANSDAAPVVDPADLRMAADEIERLRKAVNLYLAWAEETGDYPHDEQGCIAHEAVLRAARG